MALEMPDLWGNLKNNAAHRGWNQSKRQKCAALKKAGTKFRSEELFDIRHGDEELEVCPVGF